MKKCLRMLDIARRTVSDHRAIKHAITYLESGLKSISAYKEMIGIEVEKIFGPVNSLMVLQFVCPIIEYLDQYRRAHDNKEKQRFWGQKIAVLRASFRQSSWVDQTEVDRTITLVSKLMNEFKKSNSLMESVNSVIRCHLQTYKSIPRWFCSLFTFYWNNRKFSRGKRKGSSPIEILSAQKSELDWMDLLLKNSLLISFTATRQIFKPIGKRKNPLHSRGSGSQLLARLAKPSTFSCLCRLSGCLPSTNDK